MPVVRQNIDDRHLWRGSWLRDADLFLPCTGHLQRGESSDRALGSAARSIPEGVKNVMRGRSRDRCAVLRQRRDRRNYATRLSYRWWSRRPVGSRSRAPAVAAARHGAPLRPCPTPGAFWIRDSSSRSAEQFASGAFPEHNQMIETFPRRVPITLSTYRVCRDCRRKVSFQCDQDRDRERQKTRSDFRSFGRRCCRRRTRVAEGGRGSRVQFRP